MQMPEIGKLPVLADGHSVGRHEFYLRSDQSHN
jgi:hypothetical protein